MALNPDQMKRLATIRTLTRGEHREGNEMCALEAVAFVAGEPWTDDPQCLSDVIASFINLFNDDLPDDARRTRLLLPLIAKIIGTRGSAHLEQRRGFMAIDWLVRTYAAAWLREARLDAQADTLAQLPEIASFAQRPSVMAVLEAVRQEAGTAVRAADADAAWIAARSAGWDAAVSGAVAAASWDFGTARGWTGAAKAIAWEATGAVSPDAVVRTVEAMQISAVALVERMAAVEDGPAD